MQFDDGNEEVFNVEKIEPILKAVVDGVLKDAVYDDKMVAQWVDRINDGCMKELIELNLPFKYAVTAVIMQNNGAGVNTAVSSHWDSANDQTARVEWPEKKKSSGQADPRMHCIVTAFGVAF
mmetsp:Transcript_9029/g.19116  ORF Transcript_9029/g.19116 Transcript_9029/m.19116 type:complete len:122 (-) Transcript_9029:226-591(-)|eukprot:CAMPEP_0119541946 /NCGR_PEP_ID=MMETSP1344-20130328/53281_1 /TAXON_ID=236787 /ORGANISM="Florenciella parvula, Strain CCMP2471" /LENGTH=121 /DNA_ID=CAMNT_0007586057 /DNA_START=186 /DNA_END=551 /DNA_ORIENTATION=+